MRSDEADLIGSHQLMVSSVGGARHADWNVVCVWCADSSSGFHSMSPCVSCLSHLQRQHKLAVSVSLY